MYKRIIVAVGDHPAWDAPVAYAIALAAQMEAELWLLRVLAVPFVASAPDMVASSTLAMEHLMEANEQMLAGAMLAAEQAGVSYNGLLRWGAFPEMLRHTAVEVESDLVVIGAPTCPGWRRPLSGYVARKLLTRTPHPLLITPSLPPLTYGAPLWPRLLAVHDGSREAAQAVAHAARLADVEGLDLCEVMVGQPWYARQTMAHDMLTGAFQERGEPGSAAAVLATPARTMTVPRYEATALLDVATAMQCDALVLKASHAGGWYRFRHMQVLKHLLETSDLPVLLIPPGASVPL
ncbi:MAG: universal stress protein [Candidatus Tectimicrobiota bacterium]